MLNGRDQAVIVRHVAVADQHRAGAAALIRVALQRVLLREVEARCLICRGGTGGSRLRPA